MANRERNKQLIIRVTEEEKKYIEQKMKASGINNMSAYARKMMMDGLIFHIDMSHFKESGPLLSRISSNINQIAKRVNATNEIYSEDINELKELMSEIWQLQKSILLKLP